MNEKWKKKKIGFFISFLLLSSLSSFSSANKQNKKDYHHYGEFEFEFEFNKQKPLFHKIIGGEKINKNKNNKIQRLL